jgi:hypothetical protein
VKRIDFDGATDEHPDMPDGSPEPVCGACQKRNGCVVQFDTFTGRAKVCRDCLMVALDMVGGAALPLPRGRRLQGFGCNCCGHAAVTTDDRPMCEKCGECMVLTHC